MSRRKRLWYPGAIYHVMSRGNRRTTLFRETADYVRFLQCIQRAKKIYKFKIHSLCLMTNHFHLAIETTDTELWKIMQRILHPYSMDFNDKYDFTGHLFESRYTACLIEDESYFLEVSRYIHLNPVKAHIVLDPAAYVYSSYGCFMKAGEKEEDSDEEPVEESLCTKMINELVDTSRVLAGFRDGSREQYRKFVESRVSHEAEEEMIRRDIREDLHLPW